MRRTAISFSLCLLVLYGCATTSPGDSEKPSEWTMEAIGKGITVGSAANSAGVFAPIIFGIGFVMEKVGAAVKTDDKHDFVYDRPQEAEE